MITVTHDQPWTVRDWIHLPGQYLRVSMNEKVTLYIADYVSRNGMKCTTVYFYDDGHKERAEQYSSAVGATDIEYRDTATLVYVYR